jgi:tetratricopeptide (TPR) repeat protein
VEQDHGLPEQIRAAGAGIAGLSYESLGKADLALEHLKESVALDPSRENSYLALADLLDQMQKYAEAVEVLKEARTRMPDSGPVLLALGTDLVRTEHYSDGIAALREVLRRSPEAFEAYVGLANAARQMGDSKQEIGALQQLARGRPDYPMIHVLIARAMLNLKPVEARQVLGELALAEKQSPSDPDVFYLRGKVYVASGQYADALAPLRRSIELRALDPGPYYQLAKVYQKLGKPELAREQFEHVKYLESSTRKQ